MRRFHLLSALAGVVIGAAITAVTLAWAQPKVQVSERGPQGGPPALLTGISSDTFVSIKDHGDAQTVIVYKVDDKGMARLTHKAKFFY